MAEKQGCLRCKPAQHLKRFKQRWQVLSQTCNMLCIRTSSSTKSKVDSIGYYKNLLVRLSSGEPSTANALIKRLCCFSLRLSIPCSVLLWDYPSYPSVRGFSFPVSCTYCYQQLVINQTTYFFFFLIKGNSYK